MNQVLPERRKRKRTIASADIELIAGDRHIPARLMDISFAGLKGRVRPGTDAGRDGDFEQVRLEGLPALAIRLRWTGAETFGAEFVNPHTAGPVIAGFIELFVPPGE